MSEIRKHIKEELKEEFGDLVYEKAKAEVKERFWSRYYAFTDRIFAFFGYTEPRRKKIEKISEEIKADTHLTSSDTVLGMMELFTLHYANSAVELLTSMVGADAEPELTSKIDLAKTDEKSPSDPESESLNIDDA
ncbi:MAG: hypothetical protein ACO2Z9_08360 [Crocinitomicaceae bacterium]